MNNKVAIGLVAAIIILAGAYFVFNRPVAPSAFTPTPAPAEATSTTPAPTKSVPATAQSATGVAGAVKTPTIAPVVHSGVTPVVAFDAASLISGASRPMITGTANVKGVAIVIDNPQGVGIAGSFEIPVENGHWSYAAPQALKPGLYTVHLIGGVKTIDATLVVK